MTSINYVNFRGSGSESTGSVAYRNRMAECPTCGTDCDGTCENTVNFKGLDTYEHSGNKKKTSVLGTAAILGGVAIAGIVGLGYAHKTNALSKLKDGKIKSMLSKLEPAGEKCHSWCATVKTKSSEVWNKIKNFVSSKK